VQLRQPGRDARPPRRAHFGRYHYAAEEELLDHPEPPMSGDRGLTNRAANRA
jgi:hypothetical protein